MDTVNHTDFKSKTQTPQQRTRRKFAREVAAMLDRILRAAGYKPAERRTALAICSEFYEYANEAPDKPRRISLASIGRWLTSRSDDEEACKQAAIRHVGHLFNHANPHTGFQILTRYKSEEGSKKAHEYADHVMPVAAFFSELLAEEKQAIFSEKGVDKKSKYVRIEKACARLVADALNYLPKCEAELIAPTGEVYAYVSAPEAKGYCAKNPEFTFRPKNYTPPAKKEEQPRPFYSQDFDRIEDQIEKTIEKRLDEALERNSFDEARLLAQRLEKRIPKLITSWLKVAGARPREEVESTQEELITGDKSVMGGAVENSAAAETPTGDKLSPDARANPFADNAEIFESPKTDPVENLTGSINFDEALEAAIFYAKDGWNVVPICNFNPETGRCTASWHKPDKDGNPCAGKRPTVSGTGKPGDGYTAATRDLDKIRKHYRKRPDDGVGIRLDDHVLIDADKKDGGPESYAFIRDTFNLPETLTAITQGGGNHFVFRLQPESLELLKSWTRVLDKIALPGIDLKVGKCGLLYAEPTRGKKGVYRWVDPCVEIATLPHEVAEFFNTIRYKDEKAKAEKRQASSVYASSDQPREFDEDQAKYFRDVREGESRHTRLFTVAVAISKQTDADAKKIKAALNFHAAHFSNPLDDPAWIDRVAATLGGAA